MNISAEEARRAAIEECAKIAALYIINGNSIHPDIPADQMNETAKMVAHTTCQHIAEAISALNAGADNAFDILVEAVRFADDAVCHSEGRSIMACCRQYDANHPSTGVLGEFLTE